MGEPGLPFNIQLTFEQLLAMLQQLTEAQKATVLSFLLKELKGAGTLSEEQLKEYAISPSELSELQTLWQEVPETADELIAMISK